MFLLNPCSLVNALKHEQRNSLPLHIQIKHVRSDSEVLFSWYKVHLFLGTIDVRIKIF